MVDSQIPQPGSSQNYSVKQGFYANTNTGNSSDYNRNPQLSRTVGGIGLNNNDIKASTISNSGGGNVISNPLKSITGISNVTSAHGNQSKFILEYRKKIIR
jgi:hypothetical protein